MLTNILILILVAILALLVFAATKPNDFAVTRTMTINASPERLHPLINDPHNWVSWSAYEMKDPDMKRTYEGPTSGVGAVYSWTGDVKTLGTGRMEIIESVVPTKVVFKVNFYKPFVAEHLATFTLEPKGEATQVTWTNTGKNPFISKVMSIFMNMDKMIGDDFAVGLANMKTLVENKN